MTVGLEVRLHSRSGRNFDAADPANLEWAEQQNRGKQRKPTIVIGDRIPAEPMNLEFAAALGV
jgi:hypothetical protein